MLKKCGAGLGLSVCEVIAQRFPTRQPEQKANSHISGQKNLILNSFGNVEEIFQKVRGARNYKEASYSLAYLVVPNTEDQFSQPFLGLSKI